MILQKFRFDEPDVLRIAEKYFAIISVLNGLELAKREVQLLAFTAINGNIGMQAQKDAFIARYESSAATIGNIISKLSRRGLLVKDKKDVTVNR